MITLYDICRCIDAANRQLSKTLDEQVSFEFDTWTDKAKMNMAMSVQQVSTGELMSPEDCHEKWCNDRLSEGWQYGEVKDVANKLSPCLVPYDQLPVEQKVKDDLFFYISKSLAPLTEPGGNND